MPPHSVQCRVQRYSTKESGPPAQSVFQDPPLTG